MIIISTYLYPYTQVDLSLSLEGKISPIHTMFPWTYCPTAQCPPGHSTIVQTVPLSAKCPPMLIVLGRVYKGAMERTVQFEVSSIKEDSKTIWDRSRSIASQRRLDKKKARSGLFTRAKQITAHTKCNPRM